MLVALRGTAGGVREHRVSRVRSKTRQEKGSSPTLVEARRCGRAWSRIGLLHGIISPRVEERLEGKLETAVVFWLNPYKYGNGVHGVHVRYPMS